MSAGVDSGFGLAQLGWLARHSAAAFLVTHGLAAAPFAPPLPLPAACRYEEGESAHVLFSVGVAPGSPECQAVVQRLTDRGYATTDISEIELAQVGAAGCGAACQEAWKAAPGLPCPWWLS